MAETEQKSEDKPPRKRSTRREMAIRDGRLIRALATGQSLEEVALHHGISLRRARQRVSKILSRSPAPPAEFAQLQIRRLSEAMIVAYAAMSNGNLRAVDRVVKITREFDRYAGLAQTLSATAPPPALAPPAAPLALPPPRLAPPQNGEATPSETQVAGTVGEPPLPPG